MRWRESSTDSRATFAALNFRSSLVIRRLALGASLCFVGIPLSAQVRAPIKGGSGDPVVPDLVALVAQPKSEIAQVLDRWQADRSALSRRYTTEYSTVRRERLRSFNTTWRSKLKALPFDKLSRPAQVDYVLFDNKLRYELALLDREAKLSGEMSALLPFADTLAALLEARRTLQRPDPASTARTIAWMTGQIDKVSKSLGSTDGVPTGVKSSKIVAYRAADAIAGYKRQFAAWLRFYQGYDAQITWWVADPAKKFDAALESYRKALREKVVGAKEGQDEPIVGDPIGADGLAVDLAGEMIPYTPAELIAIAEKEYAFLETEAKRAAREMGFGDDWKAALEKVKTEYPPVGEQVIAVRDMAWEATRYVEEHNLVTVPALAKEIWRMEMMTPEAQKTNPFFLGGEVIQVSSPTDAMSEDEKMQALRANNAPMSRATVMHELIPGHHLQGFMADRNNTQRGIFDTPFYVEGWSLWWELHLWELGFVATPDQRMGALFWRMHRAARIIFSLRFHLGEWTPQQCIDFLVDKVGHERASATGEVRRSFNGNYSPLYQAGYLLGGMQLRSLYGDVVKGKKMTELQFHDAVLATGPMPIEMVRALLKPEVPLKREYVANWRFAD